MRQYFFSGICYNYLIKESAFDTYFAFIIAFILQTCSTFNPVFVCLINYICPFSTSDTIEYTLSKIVIICSFQIMNFILKFIENDEITQILKKQKHQENKIIAHDLIIDNLEYRLEIQEDQKNKTITTNYVLYENSILNEFV